MDLTPFYYNLPKHLIAKAPRENKNQTKLLVVNKENSQLEHRTFGELPEYLRAGDLLVINNTKVLNARLKGIQNQKEFEFLLLRTQGDLLRWTCLIKSAKKITHNQNIEFPGGVVGIVFLKENGFHICFENITPRDFYEWLKAYGEVPLPPYMKRNPLPEDEHWYQTSYAKTWGSVAAPTAGLHFTQDSIKTLRSKGIEFAELTLHIGYGTFAPLRKAELDTKKLHSEYFELSQDTYDQISLAKKQNQRIIAVGTTTLRAMESVPTYGLKGETDIFIYPPHKFLWADGLITNFHLPKSSLYLLVSAFLGTSLTRKCYETAVREEYRFYSYGDAMVILP